MNKLNVTYAKIPPKNCRNKFDNGHHPAAWKDVSFFTNSMYEQHFVRPQPFVFMIVFCSLKVTLGWDTGWSKCQIREVAMRTKMELNYANVFLGNVENLF